ncbi:MAG: GDSL-type esterase/lipase family protein [Planctomycetota bacterium]|nr:GDSL-type esterase/lipase family protein [Planctomycetota bacterium]
MSRLALSAGVFLMLLSGTEVALRAQGYGAIPSVWFDPEVGTRFHPGQTRQILAAGGVFMHSAEINDLGFRGQLPDRELDGEGGLRVVCLGDSFTFGWGVEDGETYPVQLEANLKNLLAARTASQVAPSGPRRSARDAEVLNVGLPGYNTWQEHRLYEKLVRPMAPDVVVLGWYLNDLDPLSYGVTGTLAPLNHPLAGTALLDYWVRKLRKKYPRFEFEGFDQEGAQEIKPYYDQNRPLVEHNSGHPEARPYVERNLADLGALLEDIKADGVTPVLAIFPSVGQVDALKAARADKPAAEYAADLAIIARIQRDLTEFAGPKGVAVVDLLVPFMDSEVRPYGEVDQSHPSVHGYGIAAAAVLEALVAGGLLDR